MRNLKRSYLDARYSHHRCKYWRDSIQYLRDIKEVIILCIKKDR